MGDYFSDIERVPEAATNRLKGTYGRNEPTNHIGVNKKNMLRELDWVVQFEYDCDKRRVSGAMQWMTVDFVVPSEDDRFLAGLRASWARAFFHRGEDPSRYLRAGALSLRGHAEE